LSKRRALYLSSTPPTSNVWIEAVLLLFGPVKGFTDTDALTAWAQRFLALKNQLTTSDAEEVETAPRLRSQPVGCTSS
jgi:hypothetical protein